MLLLGMTYQYYWWILALKCNIGNDLYCLLFLITTIIPYFHASHINYPSNTSTTSPFTQNDKIWQIRSRVFQIFLFVWQNLQYFPMASAFLSQILMFRLPSSRVIGLYWYRKKLRFSLHRYYIRHYCMSTDRHSILL